MSSSSSSSGVGVFSLLFLLFLGLKLTGHIDWSWWWITAPLWGSALLVVCMILPIVLVVWKIIDRR